MSTRPPNQSQQPEKFGDLKPADKFKPVIRKLTQGEIPVHTKLPGTCTTPDGRQKGTAMIDDYGEKRKDGGGRNGELVDLNNDVPVIRQ